MANAIRTEIDDDFLTGDFADDYALAGFLAHRCGDGMVYIRDQEDRRLFVQARSQGLVCDEGYVTPDGYDVCADKRDVLDEY